MTARSVLLSVLLGSDGAWLPTPLLLSTTALFGIAEGTARTALSRMTAAGEVESLGEGYRILASDLLARQGRQLAGRAGATTEWTGAWRQVIVGVGERRSAAERATARTTLIAARYGELREGVWLRPDNLAAPARDLAAPPPDLAAPASNLAEQLGGDALVGRLDELDTDPAQLVARLWDLGAWAATARQLIDLMEPLAVRLEASDHTALADGFVVNAAVLRQLVIDPLLPHELVGAGWPGTDLRRRYERFDR
ncbi:MAG: hypothetical protein GX868_17800, partial [Actinobacteria bacterium]|nr:hypothetical protein [Actinomycetota bacterium]